MNNAASRLMTFLISGAIATGLQAQLTSPEYGWAQRWGQNGTLVEEGRAVAVSLDPDLEVDRVFVTGVFSGQITIGGTTLTSVGGKDIWVAKLNTAGSVLSVRQYGTPDDEEVWDIVVSSPKASVTERGVFLCGSSGPLALVLRFNLAVTGVPLVMDQQVLIGEARGMVMSGTSLFITGRGTGFITWNNGGGSNDLDLSGNGSGGVYLMRSNSSLIVSHAIKPFTGGASCGNDIAFLSNRVYITGWYSQVLRFNSAAASQLPAVQGPRDIFTCSAAAPITAGSVLAFNLNDQKAAGSTANESGAGPIWEMGRSVVASGSGVYIGGSITYGATLGGSLPNTPSSGPFLLRYPLVGGQMNSPNLYSGLSPFTGQTEPSSLNGLAARGDLLYATGTFRNFGSLFSTGGGTVTFPGNGNGSGSPGFIACYSLSTGALHWADQIQRNWATSQPMMRGNSVAVSGCDLYLTGLISGNPFHFGNTPISVAAQTDDAFLAKATSQFSISANQTFSISAGSSVNTSATVFAPGATGYSWSISPSVTITGNGTPTVNFTLSTAATYTITCSTSGGSCPKTGTTKYTLIITPGQGGGHGSDEGGEGGDVTDEPVLYPNPATNSLRIFGLPIAEGQTKMEFWSMTGQLVQVVPVDASGQVAWEDGAMPDGVYLCRVLRNGEALMSQRLMIERR